MITVVLLLGVLIAVSSVISAVADKRLSIAVENYPFALTQLNPISGIVVYAIVSRLRGIHLLKQWNWWKLALKISVCFAVYNLMNNVGNRGNDVPGAAMLMISKLVVPISLVIEYFSGNKLENLAWKICGIVLLLLGTCIGVIPMFNTSVNHNVWSLLWRIILLLFSNVPLAFGLIIWNRYSEQVASNKVVLFWMSLCICQFFAGILLIYLSAILQGLDLRDVWKNFGRGMECVFTAKNPKGDYSSECNLAPIIWFAIELPAGCILNLSMASLARNPQGGPTLVWILKAAMLPISGVIFHSRLIMDRYATKDDNFAWEIAGLLIVLSGLCVYIGKEIKEFVTRRIQIREYTVLQKNEEESSEIK
jgi:drug/metabolite transporter (DMT)-like permease